MIAFFPVSFTPGRSGLSLIPVADKSGAVVPDAAVEIEQKGTGLKLSTSTTGAGVFSFPDLLGSAERPNLRHRFWGWHFR